MSQFYGRLFCLSRTDLFKEFYPQITRMNADFIPGRAVLLRGQIPLDAKV
jgi:hypothetical protein